MLNMTLEYNYQGIDLHTNIDIDYKLRSNYTFHLHMDFLMQAEHNSKKFRLVLSNFLTGLDMY